MVFEYLVDWEAKALWMCVLAATAVLKYPREEYTTGRKLRCSPLHTRQEVAGAVFGETMAYERAMYFKLDDDDSKYAAAAV